MPRRQKPPGYEKWTWAEIDAGRRMSKAEKRWGRIADNTIGPRAGGQRPSYGENPAGYHWFILFVAIFALFAVLAMVAG